MNPDISEFSYGYALIENIITDSILPIIGAPVFPSLRQEGSPGGGYDVEVPFEGIPLFLQFKLSHYLSRGNAKEATVMGLPYYRIHLRPTRHSNQHPMLLDLERSGNLVFYVMPKFHTAVQLNNAYLNRKIGWESQFISPLIIGPLDDADHYIAFNKRGTIKIYSEELKNINQELVNYHHFINIISEQIENREHRLIENRINYLLNDMISIVTSMEGKHRWHEEELWDITSGREPIQQIAYIARTFFGCEMLVVGKRN